MDRLRAYAQLLRLPNVFTAWADVILGWLAAILVPQVFISFKYEAAWGVTPLLYVLGASTCLYSAGMVWNDYFDYKEDRRDRPHRPIPSGRVSRREAAWVGTLLLLAGVILAAACLQYMNWRPVAVAGSLAASILLYDAWLKQTWLGPLVMGFCRFLNVLLGVASGYASLMDPSQLHLAAVVGFYIVGVTWFARKEAGQSSTVQLYAAAIVMLLALVLAALEPLHYWPDEGPYPRLALLLLAVFLFILSLPVLVAICRPEPALVQRAVKTCILGVIGLDACLAFMIVGWQGLLILLLLPPAVILGRWVYST